MTENNVNPQPGNKSIIKLIGWITGILLVVPSLINSGVDVYKTIANIPPGSIEKKNLELRGMHFNEPPLFQRKLEINHKTTTKIIEIHVYENADVYVNYSGYEQWLPNNNSVVSEGGFSFISSVYAEESPAEVNINDSQIILKNELSAEKINLKSIKDEKNLTIKSGLNTIETSYVFSHMNTDHLWFSKNEKTFSQQFKPVPGYKITEVKVVPMSINNATLLSVEKSASGDSIEVKAVVESGPIFDQWRGWVKAQVITTQEKLNIKANKQIQVTPESSAHD